MPVGPFGRASTNQTLRGLYSAATPPGAGAQGMRGSNAATSALRRLDGAAVAAPAELTAVAS
jgi:phytoene dehydrogenase-like protein